jgi:hypothetical protein
VTSLEGAERDELHDNRWRVVAESDDGHNVLVSTKVPASIMTSTRGKGWGGGGTPL